MPKWPPEIEEKMKKVGCLSNNLLAVHTVMTNRAEFRSNDAENLQRMEHAQSIVWDYLQEICDIIGSTKSQVDFLTTGTSRRRRIASRNVVLTNTDLNKMLRLDKPNNHRLFELVYSTLPLSFDTCMSRELALERTHQYWKRGIEQSNNHDIVAQALNQIRVYDWQRRLYNSARKAIHTNCKFELAAVTRLLSIHTSSFEPNFSFPSCRNPDTFRLFGPRFIVLEELAPQNINLWMEPTVTMYLNQWKVMKVFERTKPTFHASSSLPYSALHEFLRSVRSETKSQGLRFYVCHGSVWRQIPSRWVDVVKPESFLSFSDRFNYGTANICYNRTVSPIYNSWKRKGQSVEFFPFPISNKKHRYHRVLLFLTYGW